jgi:hypothetical protein
MPGSFARPRASFPVKEGIFIMTRNDSDAAGRAADIPDLAELASRIDVVLAYSWIDREEFLRDVMQGLKRGAHALPAGQSRARLLATAESIGVELADRRTELDGCLRDTREALGLLAESTAADLRAAADRAAWVAGLRDLADFLAEHPDVPVPPAWHTQRVHEFPEGDSDTERRAGVDRAAVALGVQATETRGGHYEALARFGPVEYVAVAIPKASPADDSAAATPEAVRAAA